jgi:predicted hydrocarbon binding protein
MNRRYEFSWDMLGDVDLGRPNLGNTAKVEVYRLMQFAFRDVMEATLGTEITDKLFYDAGKLAGREFYKHTIGEVSNINEFISKLQILLRDFGIGILRIEDMDMDKGELTMTVSEDLDCSGLPETGYEICVYDEGFISALLESYTGVFFTVTEVDCWTTGDRTCRFHAIAVEGIKGRK